MRKQFYNKPGFILRCNKYKLMQNTKALSIISFPCIIDKAISNYAFN